MSQICDSQKIVSQQFLEREINLPTFLSTFSRDKNINSTHFEIIWVIFELFWVILIYHLCPSKNNFINHFESLSMCLICFSLTSFRFCPALRSFFNREAEKTSKKSLNKQKITLVIPNYTVFALFGYNFHPML